jgi:hypothetical protein
MSTTEFVMQPLPSGGIFYGPTTPCPCPEMPGGEVGVRKFTMREVETLASMGASGPDVLRKVIISCLKLPEGFDPKSLLVSDMLAALFFQRVLSYGPAMKFTWACPTCRTTNTASVDLVRDLNTIKPEDMQRVMFDAYPALYTTPTAFPLIEPFVFTLPVSKISVGLRMLRSDDEEMIRQQAKQQKDRGLSGMDPGYRMRRIRRIVSIGEATNVTYTDAEMFLLQMDPRDLQSMANFVDRLDTGIDTTMYLQCSAAGCGVSSPVEVPLDANFFWPTDV